MHNQANPHCCCEYSALADEMHNWQQTRIAVLGFDIALLSAVIASDLAESEPLVASLLMVSLLVVSVAIIRYATQSIMIIGAYLQVFHETDGQGWEHGMHELGKRKAPGVMGMSKILGPSFWVMAVLSLLPMFGFYSKLCQRISEWSPEYLIDYSLAAAVLFCFLILLIQVVLLKRSGGQGAKDEKVALWEEIKKSSGTNH